MKRITIILLALITVIGLLFLYTKKSRSNPPVQVNSPSPKDSTTLIYGEVKFAANGMPAKNIIVLINGSGTETGELGQFWSNAPLGIKSSLYFEDKATGTRYQLADSYEQSITVEKEGARQFNFRIEPLPSH